MPVLVDTNILLRMADRASSRAAECEAALRKLTRTKQDPLVCAQVLIEFWVAATRPPANNGLGMTATAADAFLVEALKTLPCLPEPADIAARWRTRVVRHAVTGKPSHDARLIALMDAHAVTHLLTLDAHDFTRYSDITCLSPLQVVSGSP